MLLSIYIVIICFLGLGFLIVLQLWTHERKKTEKIVKGIIHHRDEDGTPHYNPEFLDEMLRMTDEWAHFDEHTLKNFEHGVNFTRKYILDKMINLNKQQQ